MIQVSGACAFTPTVNSWSVKVVNSKTAVTSDIVEMASSGRAQSSRVSQVDDDLNLLLLISNRQGSVGQAAAWTSNEVRLARMSGC